LRGSYTCLTTRSFQVIGPHLFLAQGPLRATIFSAFSTSPAPAGHRALAFIGPVSLGPLHACVHRLQLLAQRRNSALQRSESAHGKG
jgi:hypothetical protein